MFGLWGYGGYGFDDYGPDRRNWSDKSAAAIRRETQAKQLFDKFLVECKSAQNFPITQEVVPAKVHLTEACWKTFKHYVVSKGCTTKRREATIQERIASKDTRKGKLWVVSVTCSTHPDQAVEEAKQKKIKAAAAAEKKAQKAKEAAEKAKLEAERKAAEERALQARVEEEYVSIVSSMDEDKTGVLRDHNSNTSDVEEPFKKKIKLTRITVPQDTILGHAEKIHQARVCEIARTIATEKALEREKLLSDLNELMQAKEALQKKEAREYCDRIKSTIMELSSGVAK